MNLKNYIPVVLDWPKPGVNFLDITGLLNEPTAFNYSVNQLSLLVKQSGASSIVAVESRGFIFASPVAKSLGLPLIIVRKPNKLPGDVYTVTYTTEYSTDSLSIKANAPVGVTPFIVDDLLATGGTILATSRLLRDHFTVESISAGAIIGLDFLPGRSQLTANNISVNTVINYE